MPTVLPLTCHRPWFLLAHDFQRHGPDELVQIFGHIRPEERHEPSLVAVHEATTREDYVADIVPVEACNAGAEPSGVQGVLDAERQLPAEIARCRDPNRIVQSKDLEKALPGGRQQLS